jgi:membrane-bound metal-dependent hydrolase YbcI (DUF457 family)
LFAVTLARTPLGRAGSGATAALVLASSAPDIDIVAAVGGSSSYLEWHRGPTHGPLGVVGLGLLTAAIVWGALRLWRTWRPRSPAARAAAPGEPGPTARLRGTADATALRAGDATFGALLTLSLLGVLLHVMMDLPTSYGTRLLSPFSWRWFAMDLLPIIDIYLLLVLIGGLVVGRGSPSRQRTSAVVVLLLMALNYGVRGFAHHQALARTERLFVPSLPPPCDPQASAITLLDVWPRDASDHANGPAPRQRRGSCVVDMAAIPTFGSPFRWRVIAQLRDAYEVYDLDLLDRRLRGRTPPPELLAELRARAPNEWSPPVLEAARTPVVAVLLGFSRFPRAQVINDPSGGVTVVFADVRFEGPAPIRRWERRRTSMFTATVRPGEQ